MCLCGGSSEFFVINFEVTPSSSGADMVWENDSGNRPLVALIGLSSRLEDCCRRGLP
jgi:hypothetical protein